MTLPLQIDADDPGLRELARSVAPDSEVVVLGGTMSRNLHLVDAGLVLRVHPPFVSAARVHAERLLKRALGLSTGWSHRNR